MTSVGPGWHPDPADPSRLRWWDGTTWTEHLTHLGEQPPRPELPAGTPVGTPWVWLVALLPVISLVLTALDPPHYRYTVVYGIRELDPTSVYTPLYVVGILLALVVYALQVVFAWLDHRELRRRGVERPFPWGWTFLSSLVYLIGRTVVVRRVAQGRGMAPLWAQIAVSALSLAVVAVQSVQMLQDLTLG